MLGGEVGGGEGQAARGVGQGVVKTTFYRAAVGEVTEVPERGFYHTGGGGRGEGGFKGGGVDYL